jgi:hypothetical protein
VVLDWAARAAGSVRRNRTERNVFMAASRVGVENRLASLQKYTDPPTCSKVYFSSWMLSTL